MPKLDKKIAKKVDKAEAIKGGNFEPIKPGKYLARLNEVDSTTTAAGGEMWVAEFTELVNLRSKASAPGRQWLNLNLPSVDGKMPKGYQPKKPGADPEKAWATRQSMAEGGLKAFFEAFGFEVDSDTDEMVGEYAVIIVGVRTIQQGARKGERANQVNGIEPLPDDFDLDTFLEEAGVEADADGDDGDF